MLGSVICRFFQARRQAGAPCRRHHVWMFGCAYAGVEVTARPLRGVEGVDVRCCLKRRTPLVPVGARVITC